MTDNTLRDRLGNKGYLNVLFMAQPRNIDLGDVRIVVSEKTAALIRNELPANLCSVEP